MSHLERECVTGGIVRKPGLFRMKRFIFHLSFLLCLFHSGDLQAFDFSGIIDAARRAVSSISDLTSTEAISLPEGCRREVCHSAVESAGELDNCHRFICGGNFWGDSAVDIKCDGPTVTRNIGNVQVTYAICQMRYPKREHARELWFEIEIPISLIEPPPPTGMLDDMILSPFIKKAYADDWVMAPWSVTDREVARAYLQAVANEINLAFTNSMVPGGYSEVGAPDSEFRTYVELAYAVALWGRDFLDRNVHESVLSAIGISREYVAPAEIPSCDYVSGGLRMDWGPLQYFVPEDAYLNDFISAVNVCSLVSLGGAIRTGGRILIRGTLLDALESTQLITKISKTKPKDVAKRVFKESAVGGEGQIIIPHNLNGSDGTIGYDPRGIAVSLMSLGLAQHMMKQSHWFSQGYIAGTFGMSDMPYEYADITTAWIIASIIYHFLPDQIRMPTDAMEETGGLRKIFNAAREGPDIARVIIALDNAAAINQSALPLAEAARAYISGESGIAVVMRLENQFKNTGGLHGALGSFTGDCRIGNIIAPPPMLWPDLHHDELEGTVVECLDPESSPDNPRVVPCEETPEVVCEERESVLSSQIIVTLCREEGGPPGAGEEEAIPDREDEDSSDDEEESFLAGCLHHVGGGSPAPGGRTQDECVAQCFDRIADGFDGAPGFCAQLTANRCRQSNPPPDCAHRCERTAEDFCFDECEENPSLQWCGGNLCTEERRMSQPCRELCEVHYEYTHCGFDCRDDPTLPWCDDRCESGLGWNSYCPDICATHPASGWGPCIEHCDVLDPSVCARHCAAFGNPESCSGYVEDADDSEEESEGESGGGGDDDDDEDELRNCHRGALSLTRNGWWPYLGEVCEDRSGDLVPGDSADADWAACRSNGSVSSGWAEAPWGYPIGGGIFIDWAYAYGDSLSEEDGIYCLYDCLLGSWRAASGDDLTACWCAPVADAALSGLCRDDF